MKKDTYVTRASKTLTQQILQQNKDHLPQLFSLLSKIYEDYKKEREANPITAIMLALNSIDKAINESNFKDSNPISCKKGCSFCCHINVEICKDEADLIGAYCRQEKIPINREYLKKQLNFSRQNIAISEYSACVFLKDNLCTIYDYRPMACRIHQVFTNSNLCDSKSYPNQQVGFATSSIAEGIRDVVFNVSHKSGRLPLMLLPFSQ